MPLAVGVLLGLTALHYVLAVVSLRAAAGARLPFAGCFRSQLAAAAANRVTPGGLGGIAVNSRYLLGCGVTPARTTGAVASLHLVGGLADVVLLAALLVAGVGGVDAQALARIGPVPLLLHPASLAVLVLLAAAVVLALRSRLRVWVLEVTHLARRPRDLVLLVGASAGTTVVLGLALALSAAIVDGPAVLAQAPTVLVTYMLAMMVAGAVPVPSGIGAVDAALAGVVASVGLAPGAAVGTALLFRLVTFWLPAAVGGLVLLADAKGARHPGRIRATPGAYPPMASAAVRRRPTAVASAGGRATAGSTP